MLIKNLSSQNKKSLSSLIECVKQGFHDIKKYRYTQLYINVVYIITIKIFYTNRSKYMTYEEKLNSKFK